MCENFTRIPMEEQKRILDACMEEFARHGYQQASTNAMVKKAGIPKGTLFFYFGSKKDLYLYIIDRAVARYIESIQEYAQNPPADLFDRILYYGQSRMQFALSEPDTYRLFFNAFVNSPDEIKAEVQSRYAGYAAASMQMIYSDLDRTPFRSEVQVEKVIELVYLVLEGIFSRYQSRLQALTPEQSLEWVQQLPSEVGDYFEMIKHGVYQD